MKPFFIVLISLFFLLSACGANETATPQAKINSPTLQPEPITLTPTPSATATTTSTLQPSPTTSPTASPSPTPKPSNTPSPTPAPTDTPAPPILGGLITADSVNLRSGPDTGYALIGTAVLSQSFQIVARNEANSWWQICCLESTESNLKNEDEIWLSGEYIQTTTPVTGLISLVPAIEFPRDYGAVISATDSVNLRAGPSTTFAQIGEIEPEETVTLLGRNVDGNWLQICCPVDDEPAWIYSLYLKPGLSVEESEKRLPLVTLESEAPSPLAETVEIEAPDLTISPTLSLSYTAIISGERVNLRTGPGTDFNRAGSVFSGTVVRVTGQNDNGDWRQICCPTRAEALSWISAQFIITTTERLSSALLAVEITPTAPPDTDTAIAEINDTEADDLLTRSTDKPTEPTPESAPPEAVPATPTEALPGPGNFSAPGAINPFTGLPLPASKRNQRPILVCINNDPQARPQFGLSQADVMYEYNMEGYYITRFTGLFFSEDPEQIGPVRSARLVNYHLGALYNAPLFCSGASDYVRFTLKNFAPFPYLDVDLDDRSNNLYTESVGNNYRTRVRTSRDFLNKWLQDWDIEAPANVRGFAFGPTPKGGESAEDILIPYTKGSRSLVEYSYNANTGQYLRSVGGEPHLDGNTNQRIGLENVVVQFVPHEETDIVEDSLGSLSLRIELFGQGDVIIFRDGQAFKGSWQSDVRGATPRFYNEAGEEIPLKAGQTWISIVPYSYEIEYE